MAFWKTLYLTAKKYKWGVFLGLVLLVFVFSVYSKPGLKKVYHWSRTESTAPFQNLSNGAASPSLSPQDIYPLLRNVVDQELDVNVVDLGLIYEVKAEAGEVSVTMTMTTPYCPFSGDLIDGVREAIFSNADVQKATLRITFDPPWDVRNMSPEARAKLFGPGSGSEYAQGRGDP
jgi:metal-sulfur cluster biosynthetic enzyme